MLDLAPARRWATTPTATRCSPSSRPRWPKDGAGIEYFNAHEAGGLRIPVLRPLIARGGQERRSCCSGGEGRRHRRRRPLLPGPFVPKLPAAEGVAPRRQRADRVPPGLHHLRRRSDRRHDLLVPARGLRARGRDDVVRERLPPHAACWATTRPTATATHSRRSPSCSELEMSRADDYELGDITVHTHLTIHGAGANLMDRPRWAYSSSSNPPTCAGTARRARTSTTGR